MDLTDPQREAAALHALLAEDDHRPGFAPARNRYVVSCFFLQDDGLGPDDVERVGLLERCEPKRRRARPEPIAAAPGGPNQPGPDEAGEIIVRGTGRQLGARGDLLQGHGPGPALDGEQDAVSDLDRLYPAYAGLLHLGPVSRRLRVGASCFDLSWRRT